MAEEAHDIHPEEVPDIKESLVEIESLRADLEKSSTDARNAIRSELLNKAKTLAKEVIETSKSDPEQTKEVMDCLDSITKDSSPENIRKQIENLKNNRPWYSLGKMYDSVCNSIKGLFSSSPDSMNESKIRDGALDKLNKVIESNASEEELKSAIDEYKQSVEDAQEKLEEKGSKDGTKDKIEAQDNGSWKWKLALFILACGSLVGALFLISSLLTGCYQYKNGQSPLQLNSCNDFYKIDKNQSFCSCGIPQNPPDCKDKDKNYPFCQCPDVINQVCKDGSIYYAYKEYNPFTLITDLADFAINVVEKSADIVDQLLDFFKKWGYVFLIVIGVIMIVWVGFKLLGSNEDKDVRK